MPIPELAVLAASPSEIECDALVLAVRRGEAGPEPVLPSGTTAEQVGLDGLDLEGLGVAAGLGEVSRLPSPPGAPARTLALVGLPAPATPESLRTAAGAAVRRLRGLAHVVLAVPADDPAGVAALLEGAALAAYAFTAYRSEVGTAAPERVSVATDVATEDAVDRATVLAAAVGLAKDLVNTPPNDLSPAALADAAVREADAAGLEVRVWDETALRADGFGGILGVGGGSSRPPRLVRVAWVPSDASGSVALVGKGITFDSGGLSLKPAAAMVGMKTDMAGAATVLAAVGAAARLALPVAVTGWLCIAENLPSGTALRPDDVLRIRGGATVEVLNTDAEGRLVLADGLVVAGEDQPDVVIDVATLTGAKIVALGNRTTAAMGDDAVVARLQAAAEVAGEALWQLPLPEDLRPLLNSEVADIANVKPGNTAGGALIAALFLRHFVGRRSDGSPIPWAHLDIAGGAAGVGAAAGTGATGVMVRTLVQFLRSFDGGRERGVEESG